MAANSTVRRVDSAQQYIKSKYSDTVGLSTSILGQVLLGTIKGTKRKKEVIKFCLKQMQTQFADRVAEDPRMEIEFMKDICCRNHPNFVRFLDAVEDRKLYAICLEYVSGGDMCTHLQNLRTGIDNDRAVRYVIQLTKAVYFMHSHGYCHLDLSLENVLWDKRHDILKLCDFGLCRKFPDNNMENYFASASVRPGKKGYMAPEIYAYQRFNGMKADVFSLGVLIFILLTGFPPFTTPNSSDKCFQYMYYGKLEWLLKQWKLNDVINEQCRDLLSKIFCHPKKRISIKEMLEHEWLGQQVEDVELEMAGYTLRAGTPGHSSSESDSAGDKKEETPVLPSENSDSGAGVVNTRNHSNHIHTSIDQKPKPDTNQIASPSTPSSSVPSLQPVTSVKKRKSTTIVKKKRLSRTMKNKKKKQDQQGLHGTQKSTDTMGQDEGRDELSKLSLDLSSNTPRVSGRRAKSKSLACVSLHESATLLSEFGATVSAAGSNSVAETKTRSKSVAFLPSLTQPSDCVVADDQMTADREESPPSTMSSHSNHSNHSTQSDGSSNSPKTSKKKKDEEEYKRNNGNIRNLPKHRKRPQSPLANRAARGGGRGGHRHRHREPVDTQRITERFAKGSCANDEDNEFDDRKEGNETYDPRYDPYVWEERRDSVSHEQPAHQGHHHEERRLSDAGSVHEQNGQSNEPSVAESDHGAVLGDDDQKTSFKPHV